MPARGPQRRRLSDKHHYICMHHLPDTPQAEEREGEPREVETAAAVVGGAVEVKELRGELSNSPHSALMCTRCCCCCRYRSILDLSTDKARGWRGESANRNAEKPQHQQHGPRSFLSPDPSRVAVSRCQVLHLARCARASKPFNLNLGRFSARFLNLLPGGGGCESMLASISLDTTRIENHAA